jgi:hypothetical protein
VLDATIAAYSASRDARSGEHHVSKMPNLRGLFRHVRRNSDDPQPDDG